jgi:tetratricopeptide (TPR) repeat protein
LSVPINDFAEANEELATKSTDYYYSCCGKNVCTGCIYSFCESGNDEKCPFCNCDRTKKTDEDDVKELLKRVEVNDAGAIFVLGNCYHHGDHGLQQDQAKALELWKQAAELGSSMAHYNLGAYYYEGGDLKKAKFHYEATAIAGHEVARSDLGCIEAASGKIERAVKHWAIAASAGQHNAMRKLIALFEKDVVSRESIDTTLTAYNNYCAEMRSEARDTAISMLMVNN